MFAVILSWLGSLLGGPFATAAVNAYKAKLDAGNNAEKIAATLAAQEAQINEQRDALAQQIVIAEQGRWFTAIIRPLFALPFVVFNLKAVVWDTVLGLGFTPELSSNMLKLEGIIVLGYFGSMAAENAARIFTRR
jgi:hypothetical protein